MKIISVIREEPEIIIVISSWLLIGGAYTTLAILRYFSFHSGIWDLGVAYEQIYSVFHGLIGNGNIGDYQLQKSINLFIAPFFGLTGEVPYLLAFQSLWISFGSVPLYFISRKFGHSPLVSAGLSLSYLLYYPLGGDYWFDFHFMAIFPTFFLLFYSSYLYGHRRSAMAFAILAMSTDYLVPVIMGIGALMILLAERKENGWKNQFAWAIFAVASLIYVGITLSYGTVEASQYVSQIVTFPVQSSNLLEFYPVYVMIPILFLSLMAPEYLVLSLPFFAFIYSNDYQPYFSLMFYQYPALISPILFISASRGLTRFGKIIKSKKAVKGLASFMLILNILLFSFLTPVGNLVTAQYDQQVSEIFDGLPYSYSTAEQISFHEYDKYLRQAISMIPLGSSVMIQDNMPQLTYLYHWYFPEDINYNNLPKYALLDPYSSKFTQGSYYGSNISNTAIEQANRFIDNYGYGIRAELGGIVLLERNFTGNAVFAGMNEFIDPGSFLFAPDSFPLGSSVYIPPIYNGSFGFYGPYTFLSPGTYNISVELYSPEYAESQFLNMQIANTSFNGQTVDLQLNVNSSYFENDTQVLSMHFVTKNFLSLVEFRAFDLHMLMPIIFSGVQITELSA